MFNKLPLLLVVILLVSIGFASALELTDGLTNAWTFDEASSTTENFIEHIKAVQIDNKIIDIRKDLNMGMTTGKETIIDDWLDGNANGICEEGESCCYATDKIECYGHRADDMKKELKGQGIE